MTLVLWLIVGYFVLRAVVWAGWKLLGPLAVEVWQHNVELRRAQRR